MIVCYTVSIPINKRTLHMTKSEIKSILDNHGQAHKELKDKLYALDVEAEVIFCLIL